MVHAIGPIYAVHVHLCTTYVYSTANRLVLLLTTDAETPFVRPSMLICSTDEGTFTHVFAHGSAALIQKKLPEPLKLATLHKQGF